MHIILLVNANYYSHNYIRQVNGVKLPDVLFSLLCVCLCVRPSVRVHSYSDGNISKTVWDRGLVPITH